MPGKRFKLTFRSIEIWGADFAKQRAVIIAVAPTQVSGWLQAVLACDDGTMRQKMISVPEFELAAKNEVVMMEVEGERAAPVLYGIPADNG